MSTVVLMQTHTSIAERVRWLRASAGLSMRSLSDLAGLDPSHVRLIESGERDDPRSKTLSQLANVTGVTLDWLIDGKGDTPDPDAVRAAVGRARGASDAAAPTLDEPTGPVVVREGYDQTGTEG